MTGAAPMAVLVDFKAAFPSVSHEYLHGVMSDLVLPPAARRRGLAPRIYPTPASFCPCVRLAQPISSKSSRYSFSQVTSSTSAPSAKHKSQAIWVLALERHRPCLGGTCIAARASPDPP